jgi:hypothetical protein
MLGHGVTTNNISPRPRDDKDEGTTQADQVNVAIRVDEVEMGVMAVDAATETVPKGGRGRVRWMVRVEGMTRVKEHRGKNSRLGPRPFTKICWSPSYVAKPDPLVGLPDEFLPEPTTGGSQS